ncbi:hypothetical protein HG536_0G00330 [Torulaspora globosa]|uniref:Zn(2)-C6 fungal-type domain-containing protein n=1 Tax=Torulaspora globosa TaxID=48254 RepID=A0A7G3ZKZ0_9SACH|nr:uncharacterized protein HG536_0G00330 [Torulaspora globosa]QLL34176.1 hypothetical protein HG536_0G00330 [Torulaspora globosa]
MSVDSKNSPKETGCDESQVNNGGDSAVADGQKDREVKTGSTAARSSNPRANNNFEMLSFNDNYAAILQNLTNDNGQSASLSNISAKNALMSILSDANEANVRQKEDERPAGAELGHGSKNGPNRAGIDRNNLDALLQHYQGLLSKSENTNNQTGEQTPSNSVPDTARNSQGLDSQVNPTYPIAGEKPCDHCRRRQAKCVVAPNQPGCIKCEAKGIKCTFSELPNNANKFNMTDSGSARVKHPRSDEYANGNIITKKARLNSGENVLQQYSELLQQYNEPSANPNQYVNVGNTSSPQIPSVPNLINSLQTNPRDIQLPRPSPPPQHQFPRSSFYVGSTSVYDVNLVNHVKLDHIDQIQLSPTVALRKVAPNAQFILRDNFNQKLYIKQEQEIDLVERMIYPHGRILVDIFFKFVHPYFPILHEKVFLEKYSRSYRELTAPLLASIYSLALQRWDFHPKLIGFPKPDVTEQLNEIAYRTFFDMIERPKLSMVQTGLLILRCRSECANNWVINCAVVALAEELGLNVDCQDWRLPKWERGLRRRLAWAVWTQDKWTALNESRHSHLILGRNWLVKMLKEEDFPAESPFIGSTAQDENNYNASNPLGNIFLYDMSLTNEDYRDGTLMFKQLVSLSVIVGEIMETFYTEGATHVAPKIEQVLKLAKPLQLKLREWYHSLPAKLSMNNFIPRKLNANATLTLAYFAAEITLHRTIISTLTQDTPKELVQVCRTAAKTRLVAAIEFVRDLKNEHINAFWYSSSTGNLMLIATFASLLYVTSRTKDEAIIFRDCLRNYIWVLRIGSKSFDKSANALKGIHILLAQIPGLLTDEDPKEFMPPTSQPSTLSGQQWKMTTEQSPPDFSQLRNLPHDLLQSLSSTQGSTPNVPNTQLTHRSSSPACYNPSKSEVNPLSFKNKDNGETERNMTELKNNATTLSQLSPHALPRKRANSSGAVSNHSPDRAEDKRNSHNQGRSIPRVNSANNHNESNPITPQSVGNTVKESSPASRDSSSDNTDETANKPSTISPSSIQDKQQQTNALDTQRAYEHQKTFSHNNDVASPEGCERTTNGTQDESD